MNPFALRVYRAVLHAYPIEFRRTYGDAMVQTLMDRHRFDHVSMARLVRDELFDAARVAPQMRWESPMNKIIMVTGLATVAIIAGVAAGPLALLAATAAGVAMLVWATRPNQPIASPAQSRRGGWVLGAGVAAIGIAIAIPMIDGGELSEGWWTVFAASLLAGIAMAIAGLLLVISGRMGRRTAPAA